VKATFSGYNPSKKINTPKSFGASKSKNDFKGNQDYKEKKKHAVRWFRCASQDHLLDNCPEKAAKTARSSKKRAAKKKKDAEVNMLMTEISVESMKDPSKLSRARLNGCVIVNYCSTLILPSWSCRGIC
jgi:hypothetical protein